NPGDVDGRELAGAADVVGPELERIADIAVVAALDAAVDRAGDVVLLGESKLRPEQAKTGCEQRGDGGDRPRGGARQNRLTEGAKRSENHGRNGSRVSSTFSIDAVRAPSPKVRRMRD